MLDNLYKKESIKTKKLQFKLQFLYKFNKPDEKKKQLFISDLASGASCFHLLPVFMLS